MKTAVEQLLLLKRGVADLVSEKELLLKLEKSVKENKPLRVKLGIDPTAPDVHLGFTVPLRKLKQFQELGHQVVIIIGSYTAMVGDPSGKNATRPQLTYEAVMVNAENYREKIFKILDETKTEVVYNGEWFSKFSFNDVIRLASKITVASLLEHDYFDNRYKSRTPIALHEFIYPLMQGWDSVEIKADVELGGTDQRFNVIVGRDLQRESGQPPQVGLFLPILMGPDGKNKMSKSLNNYISIDEVPREMFGKIMSIPDSIMISYFELLTEVPMPEIREMEKGLENGKLHPKELKKRLGKEIVTMYHDKYSAEAAAVEFERVFTEKELPKDIPEYSIPADSLKEGGIWIINLLIALNAVTNKTEAKRLVEQGGVYINDLRVEKTDTDVKIKTGDIVKVGKRKYFKIKV
ncbi:MAG: tyrosine--tRNA ligase [Candidatus Firestonebacteria bacterium RIFOXYC2_FULL_39_67]|nr:MAG: tyrosine--tRNA ligase [Candidatus Firestonebacteria bacterium RIFOXYD2_FULL_39_29]OGF55444.1 MAG: tyrosine--tRNA ligase [Candidatus Firestonebacteria bacterium RIFOXYC2_FULL_39_67]OGF57717.1 MAG: tyrosine--tRNA ligase [Candidatus Firestonebacteria bacterium RifOxyC12_full_39_7]